MLEEICGYLRNWFAVKHLYGHFVIEHGCINISESDVKKGQYFRIVGSIFNDGVYRYGYDLLEDEEFTGTVTLMAVPKAVIELATEIAEWQAKNGKASDGFVSESFGDYSYQKAVNADGSQQTWKDAFKGRLANWRKI